ncbi:hypothetical protein ACROYT_G026403, partial [Oculina patagonica]
MSIFGDKRILASCFSFDITLAKETTNSHMQAGFPFEAALAKLKLLPCPFSWITRTSLSTAAFWWILATSIFVGVKRSAVQNMSTFGDKQVFSFDAGLAKWKQQKDN